MAKKCPFCQKEMPDEANFCLNCFSALGTEASPESCGTKNSNRDEKPTHKHTKKHISKPKAENALPLVNKKARQKIFTAAVLVCTFLLCGIIAGLTRKQIRTTLSGEPETMAVLVTDENGEAVTDENGDNVYEYVEVPQEETGFFGKLFGSFMHNKDDAEGTDNTYAENGDAGETASDKATDSVPSTGNTVPVGKDGNETPDVTEEEEVIDNSPPSSEGMRYETISTIDGTYIKIVGYEGHSANVLVPAFINDIPVTYIASGAFKNNDVIRTITFEGADDLSKRQFYLPASQNCATAVFYNLPNLTKITFPYELSFGRFLADYSLYSYCESWRYLFEGTPKLAAIETTPKPSKAETYGRRYAYMTSKDGVLYSSYLDGLYFYPYAKKDKSFTVPYKTWYVFINDCFYLEELRINATPSHYFDFHILSSNTHLKKVIAEGGKPFKTRYWTDGDVLFSMQESSTANPQPVSVAYYPQTKKDKNYRLPDIPEGYYYHIVQSFNLNIYLEELYVPARASVWSGMTEKSYRPPNLRAIHLQEGNPMSQSTIDAFTRHGVSIDYNY